MTYRTALIPKKGKNKFRKIVMPDKELLTYQRSKLKGLQELYMTMAKEAGVEDIAHGFIRGRNVITAAEKHIGYKATIMMDISEFFDSVHKDMLPESVQDPLLYTKEGVTGQGLATSPMLANIATVGMLKDIKALIGEGIAFSIYADDLQFSLNTTNKTTLNGLIKKVSKVIEKHGFRVNTNKTRIKYAKFGWRRILGVNVGDTETRATRKTMRKLRAARHQGNWSSHGGLKTWSNCARPNPIINKDK